MIAVMLTPTDSGATFARGSTCDECVSNYEDPDAPIKPDDCPLYAQALGAK